MNENTSLYRNMLSSRYASTAMSRLFSEQNRALIWRQLWIDLATEQKALGLPISDKQLAALKQGRDSIDFGRIRHWESQLKHDVMSHLKAYAEVAKEAEPILHLGATSAFITDNADVILFKDATGLLIQKLTVLVDLIGNLAQTYRAIEVTGFTHFQPAQPVTLGKRFALWAQDLCWDLEELDHALNRLLPLGCKGTTGTQSSFLVLFNGDTNKVRALDQGLSNRMGFDQAVWLSGQTLSRKVDTWFLNALSNLASSFSKASYDIRLLQHLGEVSEPFAKNQVGSSAMAYKKNPMMSERISGLSRFLMSLSINGTWTHSVQWLERSLDDSSNRRLVLPEAFLVADSLIEAAHRLLSGIQVDKKNIKDRLEKYRRFFETEPEIMMTALKGGSRQEAHEQVRKRMLSGKIKAQNFKIKLSGLADLQTEKFLSLRLRPLVKSYFQKYGKAKVFDSASI